MGDIFKSLRSDKHDGQFDGRMIELCEQVLALESVPKPSALGQPARTCVLMLS